MFLSIVLAWVLAGLMGFWIPRRIRSLFQAAWLEGTRLIIRDRRVHTVDLAAARSVLLQSTAEQLAVPASAGAAGPSPAVPLLVVTSDGPQVRLRLASRDRVLLPPEQLSLLANALSVARCPGGAETIAWLRAMAAWPR